MTMVETFGRMRVEVLKWLKSVEHEPRRRNLVKSLDHLLVEVSMRAKCLIEAYNDLDAPLFGEEDGAS